MRMLLHLAGAEVLGRDVHQAVGVDVEGDLDLRHAARRGRNTDELEARQGLVVAGHLALALQHVHAHQRLVVDGGGEHLLFLQGMVVFLSMILVKTPPAVSTPRESGVTSSSRTSLTSPFSTPP